jgi:hypothetical protein
MVIIFPLPEFFHLKNFILIINSLPRHVYNGYKCNITNKGVFNSRSSLQIQVESSPFHDFFFYQYFMEKNFFSICTSLVSFHTILGPQIALALLFFYVLYFLLNVNLVFHIISIMNLSLLKTYS